MMMEREKLKKAWEKEERTGFHGWDFSHLEGRWEDEALPWDYKRIIEKYLRNDYKLLDIGTGGGEFLLSLGHPYGNTSVTEKWEPNVELCNEKLAPLGICVRRTLNDNEMPFGDNSFDMVIDRHESYDIHEVKRILKPDGVFITQQVGGRNNETLSKRLIKNFKPKYSYLDLNYARNELEDNSFKMLYDKEYFPYLRFFDTGAVVYFAKVIEWEFPGFSVNKCFETLCEMNEEIERKSYIESREHRFIVAARNLKTF